MLIGRLLSNQNERQYPQTHSRTQRTSPTCMCATASLTTIGQDALWSRLWTASQKRTMPCRTSPMCLCLTIETNLCFCPHLLIETILQSQILMDDFQSNFLQITSTCLLKPFSIFGIIIPVSVVVLAVLVIVTVCVIRRIKHRKKAKLQQVEEKAEDNYSGIKMNLSGDEVEEEGDCYFFFVCVGSLYFTVCIYWF